jgi:uncharacterized membrane protein YkoI
VPESDSHKKAKTSGPKGAKTEFPISRNRRLNASTSKKAVEVERSGDPQKITQAIQRLNTQKTKLKELIVPTEDLDKAKAIAEKEVKVKLTIQNLSRTKRRFVKCAE